MQDIYARLGLKVRDGAGILFFHKLWEALSRIPGFPGKKILDLP